jgi:hypothetical protein
MALMRVPTPNAKLNERKAAILAEAIKVLGAGPTQATLSDLQELIAGPDEMLVEALPDLTEVGVTPDRAVVVAGEPATAADLYRGALARSWIDDTEEMSYANWNDVGWSLQGLAAWAPPDLAWTAEGGHARACRR